MPEILEQEEGAVEILEFLILVPILLGIALLIWQMFVFGHAMIVTTNAAHQAARAAAACGGTAADGEAAARAAAVGYHDRIDPDVSGGREIKATVNTRVPMFKVPLFLPDGREVQISMSAHMRREVGPECD